MSYYTERHGMRKPIEKTHIISIDMYSILYDCCARFFDNIAWQYPDECPDGNGCCGLDLDKLSAAMSFEIPALFKNQSGIVDKPRKNYYDTDEYDQYGLLDFIEFIYAKCYDLSRRWWHPFHLHYDFSFAKTRDSAERFRLEINSVFAKTGLLYHLTEHGMVERIAEYSVLSDENEQVVQRVDEKGLKELLEDAILLNKTPHPSARRESVEKIWDVLERLKSYYATSQSDKSKSIEKIITDISGGDENFYKIFDNEFRVLSNEIGNSCGIRHSEVYQNEITDERYYDYFFNRCFSLIVLAIQYLPLQKSDDPGGDPDELPF